MFSPGAEHHASEEPFGHPDGSGSGAGGGASSSSAGGGHRPPDAPSRKDLTRLIERSADGDAVAAEELWRAVYGHLRDIAQRQLRRESYRTCQPTTLVHEAYLRLIGSQPMPFRNRRHFFGAAARAMRQILVDESRRRQALKRGRGRAAVRMHDSSWVIDCEQDGRTPSSRLDALDVLALNEALERLEARDSRLAEIVHLRFFGGLTVEETAELLGLSPRTVASDWAFARAWLSRELATRTGTRA